MSKDADGEVKYSIGYTNDNKPVAIIDEDILENVPKSKWVSTVKTIVSEKFSEGIPISGRLIKVNKTTKNEYTHSRYTENKKGFDNSTYKDKFKSANNLDDIVLSSTNYVNEDLKHERKDNFKEFARGDVLLRVGDNDYSAKVIVGFTSGNQMVLYDVVDFIPTNFTMKKVDTHTVQSQNNAKNSRTSVSTNTNLSQNDNDVNSSIHKNLKNDTFRKSLKNTSHVSDLTKENEQSRLFPTLNWLVSVLLPPSGICECLAFSPKTGTLLSLRDISPNRGCSRGNVGLLLRQAE